MFPNTVFFGLQYYLKAYFEGPRFTTADIAQTDEFCRQHFGSALFNREGWTRLYDKHRGVLPSLGSSTNQSLLGGRGG
jgi:nicotinamide phosphoribosyltransferase